MRRKETIETEFDCLKLGFAWIVDVLLLHGSKKSAIIILFFSLSLFQLITREHFEDALKELQDEGIIVVMGKNTIRIC